MEISSSVSSDSRFKASSQSNEAMNEKNLPDKNFIIYNAKVKNLQNFPTDASPISEKFYRYLYYQ